MSQSGFVRVAAASPLLRLADCAYNAERTIGMMDLAESRGVSVLVFPELGLTGYTCNDLFFQKSLQEGAIEAILQVMEASAERFGGLAIVGLPLVINDRLFNCAVAIANGRILGIVPKTHLPTYKEFYDARFFASSTVLNQTSVVIDGVACDCRTDGLFEAANVPGLTVGVEVCEDLWVAAPPSARQALGGATILTNLSASNETIGKANYRRQLVANQSARCLAAYIYSGAGVGESTQDLVFGGHCLIAENGRILAESPRFQRNDILVAADVDLDHLQFERTQTTSFRDEQSAAGNRSTFARRSFSVDERQVGPRILRDIEAHPFVPAGQEQLRERCEEIFHIQTAGLARRLEQIGKPATAIGVSGGLDSTLALIVLCKTLDLLGVSRGTIRALTMPGFGTTERTRVNAIAMMNALGISYREIDIRPFCFAEMNALGHRPFGISLDEVDLETFTRRLRSIPDERRHDLVFENVQARVRTNLLMNTGFVIGTGDMSELALGWCTYNADHMSMYNPNVSIPKTLVRFLVRWAAENEFEGEVRRTLFDVADTMISPELLPSDAEGNAQSTESTIGPYELHDFFLFHFLRFGTPPSKILYLAEHARFDRPYTRDDLRHWLEVFLKRFFANQFKRSCLPDGPKVGSVSLSPRGDWRMPSDAQVTLWLKELANT